VIHEPLRFQAIHKSDQGALSSPLGASGKQNAIYSIRDLDPGAKFHRWSAQEETLKYLPGFFRLDDAARQQGSSRAPSG
jgi:hypothetical protein